jgi:hypothetical protein
MKITTVLFGILASTTILSSASVPSFETPVQVESQLITIAQPMIISVKR